MSHQKKQRNQGLDGLRGIAALAVVVAHSSLYLRTSDPVSQRGFGIFHDVWYVISSGSVGVQYLFVLCGFLMGYLYWWDKQISVWEFLKKRYARIFPLYTAVVTFDVLKWKGWLGENPFVLVVMLFVVMGIWHLVWTRIYKTQNNHRLATVTMAVFVGLQVISVFGNTLITAFFYKNGAYSFAGTWIYDMVVYSANMLLTTPFLPTGLRFQGLFWSLAPEILYYNGYIFLFRPFAGRVVERRSWFLAGAAVMILLLYVLYAPLRNAANLSSISILRWISFIGGMYLGWMLRMPHYHTWLSTFVHRKSTMWVTALGIPASLFSGHIIWEQVSPPGFAVYMSILTLIVCLGIVQCMLNEDAWVSRLLSTRILVIIGTCSYSMYLIHTHIMTILNLLPRPTNDWHNIIYLATILPPIIAASYVSYLLVERPYFTKSKHEKAV